jgi:hypothetical protein
MPQKIGPRYRGVLWTEYQEQTLAESTAQWNSQAVGGTEPAILSSEYLRYNSIAATTSYSYTPGVRPGSRP